MKHIVNTLWLTLLLTTNSPAQQHRKGHHGMVLFTGGELLYASHLPLYIKPHDYQLIYKVKTKHHHQLIKALETQQITILPEHFDLNILIQGQTLTIKTTIYKGHFERAGQQLLSDEQFTFTEQIFKRQLSNSEYSWPTQDFFLVEIQNNQWQLAIHAIQSRPSFDMIALIDNQHCHVNKSKNADKLQFNNNNTQISEAKRILRECGQYKILYADTKDFELK